MEEKEPEEILAKILAIRNREKKNRILPEVKKEFGQSIDWKKLEMRTEFLQKQVQNKRRQLQEKREAELDYLIARLEKIISTKVEAKGMEGEIFDIDRIGKKEIIVKLGIYPWGTTILGGRIYSTYQYPNALASLLGGIVFMGAYLWHRAGDLHKEALESTKNTILVKLHRLNLFGYLYAAGNFLIMAVLIGTKSRGGLLVFATVLLIYFIGSGAQNRLTSALHLGYLGILAVVSINKFIPLAREEQMGQAWLWIAGGLLLALAGQAVYVLFQQRVLANWADDKSRFNKSFVLLAGIVIIAAGIWLTSNPGVIDKATSSSNLKTGLHRIYYMQTAGEMILERPVLGWGGGGWQEAYKAFIDYRYPTKEVHSYYFQLGVETGFLGLLAVAGILFSFLYLAHRLYHGNRENPSRQHLIWIMVTAFLMIAGHALIDFDLSLSALTMVLWSIFGIIAGLTRGEPVPESRRERKKYVPHRYIPLGAASIVVVLVLLGGFCLLQSHGLMKKGVALVRSNRVNQGIEYMEKAAGYAPFKDDYRITLSQVYKGIGEKEKALEEAEKAVNLSRYDIKPRHNFIQIAVACGNYEAAAKAARNIIELAPNERSEYETYGKVFNKLGLEKLKAGNKEQAKEYFTQTLKTPELVSIQEKSLNKTDKKMWKGPRLKVTREIRLHLGKAHYWLGEYKPAEKNLKQASKNKKLKGEALMYLALLKDKQGQQQKADKYIKQAEKASKGITKEYEQLKKLTVLTEN